QADQGPREAKRGQHDHPEPSSRRSQAQRRTSPRHPRCTHQAGWDVPRAMASGGGPIRRPRRGRPPVALLFRRPAGPPPQCVMATPTVLYDDLAPPAPDELLVVVGPTASGKTELAVALAERFG